MRKLALVLPLLLAACAGIQDLRPLRGADAEAHVPVGLGPGARSRGRDRRVHLGPREPERLRRRPRAGRLVDRRRGDARRVRRPPRRPADPGERDRARHVPRAGPVPGRARDRVAARERQGRGPLQARRDPRRPDADWDPRPSALPRGPAEPPVDAALRARRDLDPLARVHRDRARRPAAGPQPERVRAAGREARLRPRGRGRARSPARTARVLAGVPGGTSARGRDPGAARRRVRRPRRRGPRPRRRGAGRAVRARERRRESRSRSTSRAGCRPGGRHPRATSRGRRRRRCSGR